MSLVEIEGVSKSFRGVNALTDVSFTIRAGEVHALVGENGAGKSTLMKILSGAYHRDKGTIRVDGNPVTLQNPVAARRLGIGTIYQEIALIPDLTVAENVLLNRLGSGGMVHWRRLNHEAAGLLNTIGFPDIDPRAKVASLSVARQQIVEITRELSENVRILILDEPTAVLAPKEVEALFAALAALKARGVGIVYISHRLDEVFRIADRITVLKDGSVVGTSTPDQLTTNSLIGMMIGRKFQAMFPQREPAFGPELLRVENLGRGRVRNVSFSVRAGEILGIAGLVGSGRTEIVRSIFGADARRSGAITLNGRLLHVRSPREAVGSGIGLVPEDRKRQGLVLSMPVRNNITMASVRQISGAFGFIRKKREKEIAEGTMSQLGIKARSGEVETADLSGGNQQKVALAKWLNSRCKVLLLDEPTRGIDIGAKVEIYQLISGLAGSGLGIVLVSSEMMEIIGLCDRVLVVSEGRITGELSKPDITEENIMRLAVARPVARLAN